MPKTIQRTVAFYWLRLRSREAVSYRPVEDVDWESRLADLDSMKWQEKAIDGIRYDAILGKEYPILSVSEQFDPTFMQYIDRENERVTDYMDNYLAGERGDLAKSSAFAFFPEYALIGRISGSAGKSSEPLKKALDHYWSPGGEFEWDVQPVVTVDSIERFERELKELSSFTAGFTTRRYLDSTAQEGGKTGEFYREMADAIGTDLDVEIKVSIPKDGFFPSAGRKLKGTVSDLVAFAVKQANAGQRHRPRRQTPRTQPRQSSRRGTGGHHHRRKRAKTIHQPHRPPRKSLHRKANLPIRNIARSMT